ncbi:MAG: hypothetical protein ACTSUX_06875 [Promethearchaeota archaeon]
MDPSEYFSIAKFLVKINQPGLPKEICYRTAINRLYYGIFHLIQIKLNIIIPDSEINRCHAFVKSQIEETKLRSDYSDLEAYRVEVDYNLFNKINLNHYKDALRIQERIINKIKDPNFVPYEDDNDFYYSRKKD